MVRPCCVQIGFVAVFALASTALSITLDSKQHQVGFSLLALGLLTTGPAWGVNGAAIQNSANAPTRPGIPPGFIQKPPSDKKPFMSPDAMGQGVMPNLQQLFGTNPPPGTPIMNGPPGFLQQDVWTLHGIKNLRGCPDAALQFKVFSFSGNYYAVTATNSVDNNTEIYDFDVDRGCRRRLATLPTRQAFDFELVRTFDAFRVVFLERNPRSHPHKRTGSSVFTLGFDDQLRIIVSKAETLSSEQPTCVTSWEQFGVPHVAICNSKALNNGVESFAGHSYIYCASGGYFDQCGSIATHFPQTIKHFRIFNKHYLAVANYPNQTEGRDVPTEILRYDLVSASYKHWQYLPTKAAKDICFFRLGSDLQTDHFLVAVNQFQFDSSGNADHDVSSHVYKVVGEKFEPFQALPVHKATGCLSYQNDDGRFVLVFATASGAVVYQYNGWRFVPAIDYSQHSLGPGISHFETVEIGGTAYLTVSNDNPVASGSDNLFSFVFSPPREAFVSKTYRNGLNTCDKIRSNLQADPVGLIFSRYDQAVKKNDTQFRLGRVTFNSLTAQQVSTNEIENKANMTRLGAPQIKELQEAAVKLNDLTLRLSGLVERTRSAVRNNGTYVISGPVQLNSLTSSCSDKACRIEDVSAKRVNGINTTDVFNNAILLAEKEIKSPIRLRRLTVGQRVDTDTLSGRDVMEYLQVDEHTAFTGTFTVGGNLRVNGSANVLGQVGGQTISPSTLLLVNGDQQLNWTLKAFDVHVKKLNATRINGQDVDVAYTRAVTSSENLTLLQPVFQQSMTADSIEISGLVNGIDLVKLNKESMKIMGDQIVTGVHSYRTTNLGKAVLRGDLNGKQFPDDFISTRQGASLVFNRMHLTANARFDRLTIEEQLSDLVVINGSLGANLFNRTSNSTQVITGVKTFEHLRSAGDVVTGTINGRVMDDSDLANINLYGSPEATVLVDSLDIRGDITIHEPIWTSAVKGVDFKRLVDNALPVTTGEFPPRESSLIFANLDVVGDLTPGTLDGVPTTGFIAKNSTDPIVFENRKTFLNDLSLRRTFSLLYTINGYNLKNVWDEALKIDGDQTLRGPLVVENDVDIVKLQATSTPFVPLNHRDPLSGKKTFENLTIEGDWLVNTLDVSGMIGDVHINSWAADTLMKDAPSQTVYSHKSIKRLVVDNVNVDPLDPINTVPHVDIDDLLDVLSADEPATLNSNLVFDGPVVGKNLFFHGMIDGVNNSAPLSWLRYNADQVWSGSVIINGSLRVKQYNQDSWLVNGVHVGDLGNLTIRTNHDVDFPALTFDHLVVDDLLVGGAVQGFHVDDDFVLKSADRSRQKVTGLKSFSGPLVSDSLHVSRDLNGKDPTDLCEMSPGPQSSTWVVYGNVTVKGNAKINVSLLNGKSPREWLDQVWMKSSNTRVPFDQIFSHLISSGNLEQEVINNVNLSEMNRRAMKLSPSTEQRVTGFHNFNAVEVSHVLEVDSLSSSSINGIEANQLTASVLLRDVEQDIPNSITFQDVSASNIVVDGKVNGLDFSASVMRNDRPNRLTGRKSLASLTVSDAVETCDNCLIDTVDLPKWSAKAVLRKGNFTLPSSQFESMVFKQPISLSRTLNGVLMDKDNLMTLADAQVIDGPVALSSLLPDSLDYTSSIGPTYQEVTDDFTLAARFGNLRVNGLYDGVHLSHFYNQSVLRNVDVVFTNPVVLSALSAGNIGDSSINSTIRDLLQHSPLADSHLAPSLVSDNNETDGNLTDLMASIARVVSHQPFELKFFEEVGEVAATRELPPTASSVFLRESPDGQYDMCYYSETQGEVFYDSSSSPILRQVDVKGFASSTQGDFAIATLDRSAAQNHSSYIIPTSGGSIQAIPTTYPMNCVALELFNNSCYFFIERTADSQIYCRSFDSEHSYTLVQLIPTVDPRLVAVGYHYSTGFPILVVSSAAQRGYAPVVVWYFNRFRGRLEQWKAFVTLEIIAMDCICDETQCLLATVASSKPTAIPGQVIIWRINDEGQPTKIQRLPFTEPVDAKFARLPGGRLSLMVFQSSGVDNVSFYVWRGLLQFQLVTTIRVPGARDLQLVTTREKLIVALSVTSKSTSDSLGPLRVFRGSFFGQVH